MSQVDTTLPQRAPRGELFKQYKREQGKTVRMGTFIGAGLIIAWGAKYVYDRLQVYAGDEISNLLITTGIPIAFLVILGVLAWWVSYSSRKSSDFMIATEGEMKKVHWSSRREIFGSTWVVIALTIIIGIMCFAYDRLFQFFFQLIDVLET